MKLTQNSQKHLHLTLTNYNFTLKNISPTQYIKGNFSYNYNFGFTKILIKLCDTVKKHEDMSVDTTSDMKINYKN